MEFTVIDVETANPDVSSICQIGIAKYEDFSLKDVWMSYVDPEQEFYPSNVSIHGIDKTTIRGAPIFPDLIQVLTTNLDKRIVASHTSFDRLAIDKTFRRYGFTPPECSWIDSAMVARRTWKAFDKRGYGLHDLCQFIGYEFRHHDALEDAKAAGQVLIAAMRETKMDLEGLLKRVQHPINPEDSSAIRREGNPEGILYGEVLVCTGKLQITRKEMARLASECGCRVMDSVTSDTTILLVGDQDIERLMGYEKSSKQRKAEALIERGKEIKILTESDFMSLLKIV